VALEQLWHFMIAGNVDPTYVEFYVALRVFNDQNNLILKSNSTTFPITTLPMYVNFSDLSLMNPITTTLYDNFYTEVVNNGGYFPPGSYHVIFTLYGRPLDGEFADLNQSEYDFVIEALYPPTLIFPCSEAITTVYPTFSWTPAYISSASNIQYCLRMVEIYSGQTAYQAIMSNPSYYEECNIPVTLLNYPPAASSILPNQPYAWQVTATVNGVPVVSSNVCEFVYELPDSVVAVDSSNMYAKLYSQLDEKSFHVRDNLLKFVYHYNDYSVEIGDSIHFEIIDEETNIVIKHTGDNIAIGPYIIKFGENYYQFDLSSCGLDLLEQKFYLLKVKGPMNTNYYLRFYHAEGNGENRCN